MTNKTTESLLPPVTERGRRIVLQHVKGPFKGLMQIMGHTDDFKGTAAPIVTEEFDINPGTRKGIAGLVKSTRRYLLYKEIDKPEGLGIFDRNQR